MCFRSPSMTLRRSEAVEALWRKIRLTSQQIAGFPASISATSSQETGFTICLSAKTGVLLPKAQGTTFWEDGSGAATSPLPLDCISRHGCSAEAWTSGAASAARCAQTRSRGNRFQSATRPRSSGSIRWRFARRAPPASTPVAPALAMPDEMSSRGRGKFPRSEEHTSELQSPYDLVCRLLLEKKKNIMPLYHEHRTTIFLNYAPYRPTLRTKSHHRYLAPPLAPPPGPKVPPSSLHRLP